MNFWDSYVSLCGAVNKTPNAVAAEVGISSGSVTAWKKGTIPQPVNLQKIIDYFCLSECTIDELAAGKVTAKNNPTYTVDGDRGLTDEEEEVLKQYHDKEGVRTMFFKTKNCTEEELAKANAMVDAFLKTLGIDTE